ncbi:protein STPG4 isoform X1 [Heterodontus francisci]|uniref:protein STPG4 isoform X1 n=1 Tax=Heterodontus francisci TaxID=7792 RepID=UPI00355BE5CE
MGSKCSQRYQIARTNEKETAGSFLRVLPIGCHNFSGRSAEIILRGLSGVFRQSYCNWEIPGIYRLSSPAVCLQKEGPAPGQYDVKHHTVSQIMTSSFQSKVPRFLPSPSKTPGPGTYDPIRQLPSWSRAASGLYYY